MSCRLSFRSIVSISLLFWACAFVYAQANAPMVLVPEGEFNMGDTRHRNDDQRPVHAVYLKSFYIDKYEVSNAQYAQFLTSALDSGLIWADSDRAVKDGKDLIYFNHVFHPQYNETSCEISYSGGQFHVDSGKENHPVTHVLWYGAEAYAAYYGKRLPTEAEWEKAARGTDERAYPWGDASPENSLCNTQSWVGHTTPVGSYSPAGDSPYGVSDMAGNAWEWVQDWYDETYYSYSPYANPQGPSSGPAMVLRGGSFTDGAYSDAVRSSFRDGRGFLYWHTNSIGFRTVADLSGTTTVVDDFNRGEIGSDWTYASGYWRITNGEIGLTEACTGGWRYLALFNAVKSEPGREITDVTFKWGAHADMVHMREGAVALMLDRDSPEASGYWLGHRYGRIWFWTIVNGAYEKAIDLGTFPSNSSDPVAGATVRVRIRQETDGNYFDYYINGSLAGTAVDPYRLFPRSDTWYTGLYRHGGGQYNLDHQCDEFSVTFATTPSDVAAPTIGDLAVSEISSVQNTYDQTFQIEDMPRREVLGLEPPLVRMWGENIAERTLSVPQSGDYEIRLRGYGTYVQGQWPGAQVNIDGQTVGGVTVTSASLAAFSTSVPLTAGDHRLAVVFNNPLYDPNGEDRVLWADWLQLYREDTPHVSATVTWTTDEPADSRVDFGLSSDCAVSTLTDVRWVTAHSVVIHGLVPNRQYYFKAVSFDTLHHEVQSEVATFYSGQTAFDLGGQVTYRSQSLPVSGVTVMKTGDATTSTQTDATGQYRFDDMALNTSGVLTPSRAAGTGIDEGVVSAYDAALAARHAIGSQGLSGDALAMADADGDGSVTMVDAACIARVSVGLPNLSGGRVGSWLFSPVNHSFGPMSANETDKHFVASLYGELSGNWAGSQSGKAQVASLWSHEMSQNDTLVIAAEIDGSVPMLSADLALSYDPEVFQFVGVSLASLTRSFQCLVNHENSGRVNVAIYGVTPIQSAGVIAHCRFLIRNHNTESTLHWERYAINEINIAQSDIVIQMDVKQTAVPSRFEISGSYPNPFNPAMTLNYDLPAPRTVKIVIFNVRGRCVHQETVGRLQAGAQQYAWNGCDSHGRSLPSGIYIIRVQADDDIRQIRVVKSQ